MNRLEFNYITLTVALSVKKVRRVFHLLNLPYISHTIQPDDRSRVLKVSGQEDVPVIIERETTLYESTEIAIYLSQRYGDRHSIIPETAPEQGQVFILDRYADTVWSSLTSRAIKNQDETGYPLDISGKKSLQHEIDSEAAILNEICRNTAYITGGKPTLADISVSAFFRSMQHYSDYSPAKTHKHLWKWYERITDQTTQT